MVSIELLLTMEFNAVSDPKLLNSSIYIYVYMYIQLMVHLFLRRGA